MNRRQTPGNGALCCLYFIAPSGHGFPPLDIEFIEGLCEKVNITPQLPKQTLEGRRQFKKQMRQIHAHKMNQYVFPEADDEEGMRYLEDRSL